jgi:hypothetical protein
MACGRVAGALHELDSVAVEGAELIVPPGANGRRVGTRRIAIAQERVVLVHGVRCTDGLQTLFDLAPLLTDTVWEQALESCLRKRLTTIAAIEDELVEATASRRSGAPRIRRVLALRPSGAPPTESLLETLMVQLARGIPSLPDPTRQFHVEDKYELFVARVDLCSPSLGLFIELDGEHHKGQPVYDASRETAIVAATGWLVGRFAWTEVRWFPTSTRRRLAAVVEQARQRPLAR